MEDNTKLKQKLISAANYILGEQVPECKLYECYGVLCCIVFDLAEHMQDTAGEGKDIRLLSAEAASHWVKVNFLCLDSKVSNALQIAFDGFPGPLFVSNEYRDYFCADVVKMRKAITAIATLVDFFHSQGYYSQLREVKLKRDVYTELAELSSGASKTYITPEEYLEKQKDPRYACICRVRMLWELVAHEDDHWEVKALKAMHYQSLNSDWIRDFARKTCLAVGKHRLGFNDSGIFTTKVPEHGLMRREIVRVRLDAFSYALQTRENFLYIVCCLALADMPIGSDLKDYPKHVRRVCYLLCNMYGRRDGPSTRNLVIGYLAAASFRKNLTRQYVPKNGEKRELLMLKDIITIMPPRFEKYRDERHRDVTTFDYITVDISLVTTYGPQAMEVVRQNVDQLKELIMDRVRSTPRLREKRLLADLLFVKELQACNTSLITAWVEFKPGVEEVLKGAKADANTEDEVSKMNLQ